MEIEISMLHESKMLTKLLNNLIRFSLSISIFNLNKFIHFYYMWQQFYIKV